MRDQRRGPSYSGPSYKATTDRPVVRDGHLRGVHLRATEAAGLGFGRLTIPYKLPAEKEMLENVRADMERGGIKHALVIAGGGVEVWRSGIRTTRILGE